MNLIRCESEISRQWSGIDHRELLKVIQCRLSIVLLDGQDARHIYSGENAISETGFKQTPEPINILPHDSCIIRFAAYSIPFIDDHKELFAIALGDCQQLTGQRIFRIYRHVRILQS